jgi:hypothetical protein
LSSFAENDIGKDLSPENSNDSELEEQLQNDIDESSKRGNVPTQSWRGKSAVFRIYSALTSNGYRKSIKAVRRQRNLGLATI